MAQERPRFSQMLHDRRVDLGLTTAQASQVLRLREDVLIAFEEGDYDRMPQAGYAQGMLSSYARYLNLDARVVTNLFLEELHEHMYGTSSHELRRRTREGQAGRGISGYDVPGEDSRPKAYVEYKPLLPTSGGPAGDMGNFATTTPPHRRSVPLAGVNTSATSPSSTGATYGTDGIYARGTGGGTARTRSGQGSQGGRSGRTHQYNSQLGQPAQGQASTARRRSDQQRRQADGRRRRTGDPSGGSYGDRDGRASGRTYRRDDVQARRVRTGDYEDDLRYGSEASPYAAASTISGRRSSRNIASTERPNVRRRSSSGSGSGSRGGSGGRGRRGSRGASGAGQMRLFLAVVVVSVLLAVIVIFSVSSCVGLTSSTDDTTSVAVSSVDATTDDDTTTDDATDEATSTIEVVESTSDDETDADATTDDAEAETVEATVVEVTLESGTYSWIEITCDGVSEVADSYTGPWSASYTVTDSITITVGNPDSVTVTKNGEAVSFSSSTGSLGSVTIEGTDVGETEDDGTTSE